MVEVLLKTWLMVLARMGLGIMIIAALAWAIERS